MKNIVILIAIVILADYALALNSSINGDCVVDFRDFALLANSWGTDDVMADGDSSGTVDIGDLVLMTDEWLEFESDGRSPVIQNLDGGEILQGSSKTLTIIATDEQSLTYSIQSLPDANQGTITGANSVPYNLASNTFEFNSDPNYAGVVNISIGVDDGTGLNFPCGGLSTALATIRVNSLPVKPTASSLDTTAMTYVTESITLQATDDGQPVNRLKYIITSLPANAIIQDPASGAGVITKVPYTIANRGNVIWFMTETSGTDSFQFKVNDYGTDEYSGDSNTATITVDVNANALDSLYFDNKGVIEISDSNSFDITTGWAVDFWISTIGSPFDGLMKKRDTGRGWEAALISGKPAISLYSDSGLICQAKSLWRIDDGQWHEVAFIYDANQIAIQIDAGACEYYNLDFSGDLQNDANLFVGLNSSQKNKGKIDKLRFFSNVDIDDSLSFIQGTSGRTTSGDEVVLGSFGKASDVLFMFDEGTGNVLTDEKLGLTGQKDDDVKWQPKIEIFTDASVVTNQIEMEKNKCNGLW